MDKSARIAAISDIHGNSWALEAVLEDIRNRGIDRIVNLGDCLYGPLDPAGTADLLLDLDAPTVSGNEDRIIFDPPGGPHESRTLEYVRNALSDAHLDWLRSLPPTLAASDEFLMFHGTPDRDDEYLLQKVDGSGVVALSPEALQSTLGPTNQFVVLCGHDHTPGAVTLPDGRLVVNPGSVGLQAYTDDSPYPHVIATGSPEARYAVLERSDSGWSVEHIVVAYDHRPAADLALKNGRPDWAAWLATGRARLD